VSAAGQQVHVAPSQTPRRAARQGEGETAGVAVQQQLDLVEERRHPLHLVDQDVPVTECGKQRAGQRLRVAGEPQALGALLEVDHDVARPPQHPEQRGLAGLAGAEDQARLAAGRTAPERARQPASILHHAADNTPQNAA